MKIETKYNYGDTVWYMKDNKPQSGIVAEMRILFTYSGYSGGWNERAYPMREEYAFEEDNKRRWLYIPVSILFPTKEDLLKSL